jgi:hypothetical protein
MNFIPVYDTLPRHRKTKKLMRLLDISLFDAMGYLTTFWFWAMDFASNGELDKYDPCDIADAATWSDDPNLFLNAMIEAGFVDKIGDALSIHDWMEYGGKLLTSKQQHAKRMADVRAQKQHVPSTCVSRDDHVPSTCVSRDEHVPSIQERRGEEITLEDITLEERRVREGTPFTALPLIPPGETKKTDDASDLPVEIPSSKAIPATNQESGSEGTLPHVAPTPSLDLDGGEEPKRRRTVFKVPTFEEVAAYAQEQGSTPETASRFYDHFLGNGWMAGRVKMKDWKAALRNWIRNNFSGTTPMQSARPIKGAYVPLTAVYPAEAVEQWDEACRSAQDQYLKNLKNEEF